MDFVSGILNWSFLQEPIKRWFLFIGFLILTMIVWNGVLSFMRD